MSNRQFATLVALSTLILGSVLYVIFRPYEDPLKHIKVGTSSLGVVKVLVTNGSRLCLPNVPVRFQSSNPPIDSTKTTGINGEVQFTLNCFPTAIPYIVTALDSSGQPYPDPDSGLIAANQVDNDTLTVTNILKK
ncbi:MAG: hypothetical protein HYZ54_01635 [Ignavibacteriae bacterium]|nr:hypothetical protein [Ignavibacteriota bacterium]